MGKCVSKQPKLGKKAAINKEPSKKTDEIKSWEELQRKLKEKRLNFTQLLVLRDIVFDESEDGPFLHDLYQFLEKAYVLTTLKLTDCGLDHYPYYLPPNVQHLDLSGNRIPALANIFEESRTLKEVNLSCNCLTGLWRPLNRAMYIERLNLASNCLTEVSRSFFSHLPELVVLDLSCNKIGAVEFSLADLPALEHLNLSHNNVRYLPSRFFSSSSPLKALLLTQNPINYIPAELKQLANLTIFEIDCSPWVPLPEAVSTEIVELSEWKKSKTGRLSQRSEELALESWDESEDSLLNIVVPTLSIRDENLVLAETVNAKLQQPELSKFLDQHKNIQQFLKTNLRPELLEYLM